MSAQAHKILGIRITNDVLTIEIGVQTLAHAALHSAYAHAMCRQDGAPEELFAITDPMGFAQDVKHTLQDEGEDGESMLTQLLDKAIAETIDGGSEFFVDKRDK